MIPIPTKRREVTTKFRDEVRSLGTIDSQLPDLLNTLQTRDKYFVKKGKKWPDSLTLYLAKGMLAGTEKFYLILEILEGPPTEKEEKVSVEVDLYITNILK